MLKRVFIHVLFWVAYVLFKTYLNFESGIPTTQKTPELTRFIIILQGQLVLLLVKVPLVYILFYVTEQYLTKTISLLRALFTSAFLFCISIVLFILLSNYVILGFLYGEKNELAQIFNLSSAIYYFFVLSFPVGIAIAIKVIRLTIKQKEIEQELVKNKLETELNMLKSQVNPHFLFNTLNNIYSLALQGSNRTAPVVMKLSKLMRFLLYESKKKHIKISEEIKLLEDYVELEMLRYNDKLKLRFNKTVDDESALISPLLLLPLIENAFKHGASESSSDSFIDISLCLKEDNFKFEICNSVETLENNVLDQGIGLKNVKRQLELLYKNFKIDVERKEKVFKVSLSLKLSSNAA